MFRRLKLHFQNIVASIRQRRLISYYEKLIKKGWEKNLKIMDEEKRIDQAIALMEAEAKLRHWKHEFSM